MSSKKNQNYNPNVPHLSVPPDKMRVIDIKKTEEHWSEYHLADGSILKLKPVMMEIKKAEGYYMPNGEPLYLANLSFVFNNKVPDKLKKSAKKKAKY